MYLYTYSVFTTLTLPLFANLSMAISTTIGWRCLLIFYKLSNVIKRVGLVVLMFLQIRWLRVLPSIFRMGRVHQRVGWYRREVTCRPGLIFNWWVEFKNNQEEKGILPVWLHTPARLDSNTIPLRSQTRIFMKRSFPPPKRAALNNGSSRGIWANLRWF